MDSTLGFAGVGAVIPYPAGLPDTSFVTLGGQTVQTTSTVISGFSAAVSEPTTWALFGAGLAVVTACGLRQKSGRKA